MLLLVKDQAPLKLNNQTTIKMFQTPAPSRESRLSHKNIKRLRELAKALESDTETNSTGLRERARNIQIDFNNIIINQDIIANNIINNIVAE